MPTTGTGQMVKRGDALKQIATVLQSDAVKAAIAEQIPLAMRQTLTADRAVRAAWQNILSNADEMVKCEPKSIAKAITEAVTHGLIVDGMTGQAYLVRFGNQCVFMPGYRGKIALALRGRDVVTVNAHAVFKNDTFKANFAKNDIEQHLPWRLAGKNESGDCLGYYAIAELRSGSYLVAWIDIDEVEQIHKQVRAQRHGKETPAWKTWPHEMGKKCAIHRLGKRMDLDPSAAAAFMRDDLLVTKTSEEPVSVNADPNDLSDLAGTEEGGKLDKLTAAMEGGEKKKAKPAEKKEEKEPEPKSEEPDVDEKEAREEILRLIWWVQHAGKEGCDVIPEHFGEATLKEIESWRRPAQIEQIRLVLGDLTKRFPELSKELKGAEKSAKKKEAEIAEPRSKKEDRGGESQSE